MGNGNETGINSVAKNEQEEKNNNEFASYVINYSFYAAHSHMSAHFEMEMNVQVFFMLRFYSFAGDDCRFSKRVKK